MSLRTLQSIALERDVRSPTRSLPGEEGDVVAAPMKRADLLVAAIPTEVLAPYTALIGLVVAFAGYGLLTGRTWARVVAITLAALSAIANFLWLPHYPFWALLIISVDVFVIWAVAVHGREVSI